MFLYIDATEYDHPQDWLLHLSLQGSLVENYILYPDDVKYCYCKQSIDNVSLN